MSLRYFTDAGIEVPAVTTEQMIEVDRVAIEDTGPNLLQMMENAGYRQSGRDLARGEHRRTGWKRWQRWGRHLRRTAPGEPWRPGTPLSGIA